MCFWQRKYSERGCRSIGTATEIIANISTRIVLVLMSNISKIGLAKSEANICLLDYLHLLPKPVSRRNHFC